MMHRQALEDKRLLPEASTLFMAGFESKPLHRHEQKI